MRQIAGLYRVEHAAAARGISGTAAHLAMRRTSSAPLLEQLHAWLTAQQDLYPPKSPIGKAISYALGAWAHLTVYLDDARLALDNNAGERSLRIVALGRKNFSFLVEQV